MATLRPLRVAALMAVAAADLARKGVDAGASAEWLVVPLLLDFQPMLLPIDTSRRLREQLGWFCRVHGLDAERCAGASASGILQVVDVDAKCRQPQAADELPGFLMLRNAFPASAGDDAPTQPVAKWRQDGAGNIARDLCRFARDHGDVEKLADATLEDCMASLTATLDASFDWMLALETCDQQAGDTTSVQAPSIEIRYPDRELFEQDRPTESGQSHYRREERLSDHERILPDLNSKAEASDCEEDTCSIKITPNNPLQPEVVAAVYVDERSKIEFKSKQPKLVFEELQSLQVKVTSYQHWDTELPQWIVAATLLTLLAIVYLAFDVALLGFHKLRRSIETQEALRCVGSMSWSLVQGSERSVLKSDDSPVDCAEISENCISSPVDATISSKSELQSPEAVHSVGGAASVASGATNPSRACQPAMQNAFSSVRSVRRARAWSSPCLDPGLPFQSIFQSGSNQLTPRPSRNTTRSSLYRALSFSDDSDNSSMCCHPSFTRAAMTFMMTHPSSVLQAKSVVAAPTRPTPPLSSLAETEDTPQRPHHLMAALRIQRIWRSRSGMTPDDPKIETDNDNNLHQLSASIPLEALAAMERIAETVDGDCVLSSAETKRLRSPFARFPPSRPKL